YTTPRPRQEADTENTQICPYLLNPQLNCFEKYISRDWYESEDEYINLKEASTTQLNNRVIYSLHQYLEDETVGKRLYRIACADFADWDASVWTKVHPEIRKKFRKVMAEGGILMSNNGPLPERLEEFIQEGLEALEAEGSEASVRSPINKGKQPVYPIDKEKRTDALENDQLDPNHPKNIGQHFDDSGNSVHTDKTSSLTRAHRFYQTGQLNNTAAAGPSKQNTTAPQQQQQDESQKQARLQQPHDPNRYTKGPDNHHHNRQQQQHTGTYGPLGPGQQNSQGQQQPTAMPGYNGVPAYGLSGPHWNSQRYYACGPSNNPGRPGPSGPQGHSGYDGPFGPYGGGYNGPFGPYGYSGTTAATNGSQPQHNYNYGPDYTQARQSRTDIDYEDRRFQRCQDTLIKAYTEKDKYTGAAGEFLMPKLKTVKMMKLTDMLVTQPMNPKLLTKTCLTRPRRTLENSSRNDSVENRQDIGSPRTKKKQT
ncbi:hypothetical protein E4U19_000939, partial [Claviceps sp. Clav32 group G5]